MPKLIHSLRVVSLAAILVAGCSSDDKPARRNGAVQWTVTATAGQGGSVGPASLGVTDGETAEFTVTPDEGYRVDFVEGCDGTLDGNVYTTAPVHENCEVEARFTKQTFTLGGTVSGLQGIGLLLRNQDGVERTADGDGKFQFPTPVAYGETWEVAVAAQPVYPNQTCTVEETSGTVSADVDVRVDCVTNQYPIEVVVTGLLGDGLLLLNNGSDDLAIDGNGTHIFASALPDLHTYAVDVVAQPSSPLQTCTLDWPTGLLDGKAATLHLHCVTEEFPVAVTVSGLTSGTVVLRNLGSDELQVDANGTYEFPMEIEDGSAYAVTVASQPGIPGRSCRVHGGEDVLQGRPAWAWIACTNYALEFDGSSGHVTFPTQTFSTQVSMPANGQPYTVEAWIRPDTMGLLGIAAWGNYGTANEAIAFRLTSTGLSTSWWGATLASPEVNLTDGWHHVATSWDGIERRLFLDGVEVASDTPAAPHAVPDGRDFRIGLGYDNQYFDGALDDVRVWSTALTAGTLDAWRHTEVLDDHPNRDDLAAAWAFRQGMGTAITDTTRMSPALQGQFSGAVSWVTVDPGVTLSPSAFRLANGGSTATVTATTWGEYRAPVPVDSWVSDRETVVSVAATGLHEAEVTTGIVGLGRVYATVEGGASARALVYSRTSGSRVILVDPDQSADPETGLSWSEAFASLADAMQVSTPGDEIWVAEGTYTPSDGTDRFASFALKSGVKVYGGFQGTETNRSQRDPDTHLTTLSGILADGQSRSYHVVTAAGADSTAVLDGFTITGGKADGAANEGRGGGLLLTDSEARLLSLEIVDNTAAYGGGMYASGAVYLSGTTFTTNYAGAHGGGLYLTTASGQSEAARLTDVEFNENTSGGPGGGMSNMDGSDAELTRVTFFANAATGSGGGLYNLGIGSNPLLWVVTFSNNSSGADGGGMVTGSNTEPQLDVVTFTGNSASMRGGGMLAAGAPLIVNTVFDGNTSDSDGGGINIYFGDVTMLNVLVVNNQADVGGGMRVYRSDPTFTNVTVARNTARYDGGIGLNLNPVDHIFVFQNSILWGNTATWDSERDNIGGNGWDSEGNELYFIDSIMEAGCKVGGNIWTYYSEIVNCTRVSNGDPLFVDPNGGNFRLQAGSAALNNGDNALLASWLPVDLDGNPRIVYTTVDLGPYERQ